MRYAAVTAQLSLSARRAWIEIDGAERQGAGCPGSLSARRAWIEIARCGGNLRTCGVALRKESVDRNSPKERKEVSSMKSLSARRAWIEMACVDSIWQRGKVALRKESVDRNKNRLTGTLMAVGRSPQGERG